MRTKNWTHQKLQEIITDIQDLIRSGNATAQSLLDLRQKVNDIQNMAPGTITERLQKDIVAAVELTIQVFNQTNARITTEVDALNSEIVGLDTKFTNELQLILELLNRRLYNIENQIQDTEDDLKALKEWLDETIQEIHKDTSSDPTLIRIESLQSLPTEETGLSVRIQNVSKQSPTHFYIGNQALSLKIRTLNDPAQKDFLFIANTIYTFVYNPDEHTVTYYVPDAGSDPTVITELKAKTAKLDITTGNAAADFSITGLTDTEGNPISILEFVTALRLQLSGFQLKTDTNISQNAVVKSQIVANAINNISSYLVNTQAKVDEIIAGTQKVKKAETADNLLDENDISRKTSKAPTPLTIPQRDARGAIQAAKAVELEDVPNWEQVADEFTLAKKALTDGSTVPKQSTFAYGLITGVDANNRIKKAIQIDGSEDANVWLIEEDYGRVSKMLTSKDKATFGVDQSHLEWPLYIYNGGTKSWNSTESTVFVNMTISNIEYGNNLTHVIMGVHTGQMLAAMQYKLKLYNPLRDLDILISLDDTNHVTINGNQLEIKIPTDNAWYNVNIIWSLVKPGADDSKITTENWVKGYIDGLLNTPV